MDEWVYSLIGLLCAAGFGFLGMFLGRRSQVSKIVKLQKEIIESEVKAANEQIQEIDDTTEMHVNEIKAKTKNIESLDGDNLADEFNSAFK